MVVAPHEEADRLDTLCHDLRQYVAAGLLISEARGTDPGSEAYVRLATIHTVFEQIGMLIDAEVDDPRPRRAKVDLRKIVADVVQVAQARPEIHVEMWLDPRATACGDPVLLRRAVANILDNAARATGDRGTIEVRLSTTESDSVIEVTDNGIGFGRAPRGSGQGMSMVATAVEACRGRLEIVSGPGPGTTVRMVLPRTGAV